VVLTPTGSQVGPADFSWGRCRGYFSTLGDCGEHPPLEGLEVLQSIKLTSANL